MNVFQVKVVKKFYENGKIKQRTITSEVELPSEIDEIKARHWDAYFRIKEIDPDWLKEMESHNADDQLGIMATWDEARWDEYYSQIIKYLSCFTDSEILYIANAPMTEETGNGLLSIYFSILGMINSYEPVAIEEFEYKGEKYIIDTVEVDRFGKTHYGKNFTANQVIDALQYEHVFNVKGEDNKYLIADRRYQIDLALIAVLTKKVLQDGSLDERPLDFIERGKWTDAKIEHFKDMPMSLARNVAFFLTNLKKNSLNTLIRALSLRHSKSLPMEKH